ncbi:MAG: NFACT family protein [Thermomicrobiales bacterium]|nr:NFACT family protein [Thermomicrobiales bacterium]
MPDPYDLLTIAAVVDELNATLGNGRVQRIGLVDPRTVGAEIYAGGRRHYLLASANDALPRLRLAEAMPSLDTALITPFGLLLRKYVRGGVIASIDQPPLERLVRVSIAKRVPRLDADPAHDPELYPAGEENDAHEEENDEVDLRFVHLYVELMGRHSNLILVDDDGLIMESVKRVTPEMSRVRLVLPRHHYAPPPPPDRLDPRTLRPGDLQTLFAAAQGKDDASRTLVSGLRGFSPTMAREVMFLATGEAAPRVDALSASALDDAWRGIPTLLAPLSASNWSPRLYRDQTTGEAAAFAPLPYAHLAAEYTEEPVASISAAAAQAENAAQIPSPQRHAQRRQRLLALIEDERQRLERRHASLAAEAARASDVGALRQAGELIYAYAWQIAPGQEVLDVDGQRVKLDPLLSAPENAQAYFERYRKAQSASAQIPDLVEQGAVALQYLDQLATQIAQAPGFAELEALATEWQAAQATEEPTRKRKPPAIRRPQPLTDDDGNLIYIGRSGPQNDLLTFELAGPDDTWLHARGVGGSHVIIRWARPGLPENPLTVEAAAALAAWYSSARESGGVEVDVAPRRHVRKIKGAGPGMVTYRHERTLRVRPRPESDLRDVLRQR